MRDDPNDPRLAPVMAALAALADAESAAKERRADLGKAVADAIRQGVKPATLVRQTEKSAETIRTMARENGIKSLRDPNTRSFNSPADRIASELRDQIQDGELEDGQQIPTVADLMVQYTASQASVQKAIAVLASEGLVTIRPGKGVFACAPHRGAHAAPPAAD